MDSQPSASPATTSFLNVDELLERSQPRARVPWGLYFGGVLLLVVVATAYAGARLDERSQGLVELVSALLIAGAMGAMVAVSWSIARTQRSEQQRLEAVEELVQLRRWPEAAMVLQGLLSRPMRLPQARIQGLIFLAMVLGRYHRFEDAIAVHNYLLENVMMDEGTAQGLRLGRAMAMLREDHLFDADRAISELRHGPRGESSGGLALVEMYRDVKTGHPAEAVEIFLQKLPAMREQLGHRLADAYALLARAYDALGREPEAQAAYQSATTLAPRVELERRYPEVASLAGKYPAAPSPMGAMGEGVTA